MDRVPSLANNGYPPGRMRLRISLELCRAEGHLDALVEFVDDPKTGKAFAAGVSLVDHIDRLIGIRSDVQAITHDPFVSIAYDWVNVTLPSAQAFARNAMGAALYPTSAQRNECSKLVERLLDGLPPNEIGSALAPVQVDARSAVLAAWLISLDGAQSGPGDESYTLFRLNEKTLRGIEYIELQRCYLEKFPRTAP